MKILVFGATGPTGQHIVRQGLELGYEITAFVRDPSRLNLKHQHLSVITGDVQNSNSVLNAVRGFDLIISALGNGKSLTGNVFSVGIKNIVDAMKQCHIRRIIVMSAFGVGNSLNRVPVLPKVFYKTLLKSTFADKEIGEKYLNQSNLDWTLVHPVILTNGPKSGVYKSGEIISVGAFPKISRADVADFMLRLVSDKTTNKRTFVISS
ncbi:NAD(P)-dependent oxidoreductase [Neobacillus cucumis]|uniref:NAD(P)-dependent oxidoreductase n=1 Tax=Neobacillus cucumis TaxID=1740721 RepID=UPI001963AE09|nr:SDR family oxidoreductase [Neobacillus cucumis]MBM7655568.1 putative NADH-flavin reductase [Neobacillus cucumis]